MTEKSKLTLNDLLQPDESDTIGTRQMLTRLRNVFAKHPRLAYVHALDGWVFQEARSAVSFSLKRRDGRGVPIQGIGRGSIRLLNERLKRSGQPPVLVCNWFGDEMKI